MRGKSVLILAGLVLALGSYVLFVERTLTSTDERRTAATRIVDFASDSVREVRIDRGGEVVHLKRAEPADTDEPSWRLVEPFGGKANREQVKALLETIVALERQRTIEGLSRADAGLTPPRATVTMVGETGQGADRFETILEIGPDVPATDSMLLAIGGREAVDQVDTTLWSAVSRAPGDWRDATVLTIDRDRVHGARIIGPHGTLALTMRENELWVASPYEDRANPTLGGKLLGAIAQVRAERFVDQPWDTASADAASSSIEIDLEGQPTPTIIRFGSPRPEDPETVLARIGNETLVLRSPLTELVGIEPAGWRDPRWATLQVFGIHKAIVTDDRGTTVLARQDAEWTRDGKPVDYALASELLYAVTDLESTTIADRSALRVAGSDGTPAGASGSALLTIRLESEPRDGMPSHENLSLFPLSDGRLMARTNRRDAVLLFEEAAVQTLRERLAALRAAPLVTEASDREEAAISSVPGADPRSNSAP